MPEPYNYIKQEIRDFVYKAIAKEKLAKEIRRKKYLEKKTK